MSKKRKHVVHVWFLDNDLSKSAEMLTDKCLIKTIDACIGCIVSTCMYLAGIRSRKFYSYFFSKENIDETMSTKFIGWPLHKKPSFNAYSWVESKWCRMCHENYDLVVNYLSILLDEYTQRHSSMHPSYPALQWAEVNEITASFPYASIEDVIFPWKAVDPQFRTEDIVGGYRKQYCATQIEDGDAFKAYSKCKRDIPAFVVEAFNLKDAFER